MTLKIQLGGGLQSYEHPDHLSIDIIPSKDVKWAWDLERGLPKTRSVGTSDGTNYNEYWNKVIDDNSVDEILAKHVLEHIHNLIPLMDECHDALKIDGKMIIKVPNAYHIRAAWSDPTHCRAFVAETFDYFTHETIAAYPYTKKEWIILKREVRGTPPDDLWEIYCEMRPVKSIPIVE